MSKNRFLFVFLIIIAVTSPLLKRINLGAKSENIYISITISDSGSSAQIIDRSITRLLENKLKELHFIKNIETSSKDGQMNAYVQLHKKEDTSYNRILLRNKINEAYQNMPKSCSRPQISEGNRSLPAFIFTIENRNEEFCNNILKPQIEAIKEANLVELYGEDKEILGITKKQNSKDSDFLTHSSIALSLKELTNSQFAGSLINRQEEIPIMYSNANLSRQSLNRASIFSPVKTTSLFEDQLSLDFKKDKKTSFSTVNNKDTVSFCIYADTNNYSSLSKKLRILLKTQDDLDYLIIKDLGQEETRQYKRLFVLVLLAGIVIAFGLGFVFREKSIVLIFIAVMLSSTYFAAVMQVILGQSISYNFFVICFLNLLQSLLIVFWWMVQKTKDEKTILFNVLNNVVLALFFALLFAKYVEQIEIFAINNILTYLILYFFLDFDLSFKIADNIKIKNRSLQKLLTKLEIFKNKKIIISISLFLFVISGILLSMSWYNNSSERTNKDVAFSINFKSGIEFSIAKKICTEVLQDLNINKDRAYVICNYKNEKAEVNIKFNNKKEKKNILNTIRALQAGDNDFFIYLHKADKQNKPELRVKIFSKDYDEVITTINSLTMALLNHQKVNMVWNNYKTPAESIDIKFKKEFLSKTENPLDVGLIISNILKNPIISKVIVDSKEYEVRFLPTKEINNTNEMKTLKLHIEDKSINLDNIANFENSISNYIITKENTREYLEFTVQGKNIKYNKLKKIVKKQINENSSDLSYKFNEEEIISPFRISLTFFFVVFMMFVFFFIYTQDLKYSFYFFIKLFCTFSFVLFFLVLNRELTILKILLLVYSLFGAISWPKKA